MTSKFSADTRFPSASELGQIAAQPAPARIADPSQKDVATWDLKDFQEPTVTVARVPISPWERLLADAAAKRQGLLWASEPMHCLARQVGRFVLEEGGIPNEELTRFMAARCGVTEPEISLAHAVGTAPASMTDEQFFASGRSSADQLLSKLANGNLSAGIWAGRDKGKAVVMMPFAPRRAKLDRVPVAADPSGHVVVTGEVLTPADRMEALSNYGRFGFRHCVVDARVRLPRFSIDCETKPDDPASMIEVAAFAPGRITGPFVASLVIWPTGRAPMQYARTTYGALGPVQPDPNLPAGLAQVLNQVRKDAGLGAVTFNVDESITATRVAPHYFAALTGGVPETIADRIVLGMRAGWQIPGLVGYGHFTSSLTRGTNDATALLVSALNRPSGRETLLDPDVKIVAIGPAVSREHGFLAAVFTSYSLLDPAVPRDVVLVLAALNAKRKERGLVPAVLVDALQPQASAIARSVETGQQDPDGALRELLEKSAATFSGNVQGWVLAAEKFEQLPFPDTLLMPWAPHIAIGVAHFRPKGSPWGAHGALIVAASSGKVVAGRSVVFETD